jgi:hypothetical protein
MFYHCCGDCGERWLLGDARTCKCPEEDTWVALTEEELKKTWYAMKHIMGWYSFQEIAKAIESQVKEKNNV